MGIMNAPSAALGVLLSLDVIVFISAHAAASRASETTGVVDPTDITNATWTPNKKEQGTTSVATTSTSTTALSMQTTVLLVCFLLLVVAGLSCFVYSVCGRWKLKLSESGIITPDRRSRRRQHRSTSFFREDLLCDDELTRLWVCWYCDFANYEMKTRCALCGHEKKDKHTSSNDKSPRSRPETLTTVSMTSTAVSPSPGSSAGSGSGSFGNRPLSDTAMLQTLEEALMSPPSPSFFFATSPNTDLPFAFSQTPPSPTPMSTQTLVCTPRSQRRKEWQPTLNDRNELVWKRHASIDNSSQSPAHASTSLTNATTGSTATSTNTPSSAGVANGSGESVDAIVNATAFVTHNEVTSEHPHGLISVSPADQAPAYPPFHPIPLRGVASATSPRSTSASQSSSVPEDRLSAGMDPFALESLRTLQFPEKHRWFMQETTGMLNVRFPTAPPTSPPRSQHQQTAGAFTNDLLLLASRQDLLRSAVSGLMSVSKDQLRRRPLRVQFAGEPGLDAGGVVREWFALTVAAFLDDSAGLFQCVNSPIDGLSYTVNLNAKAACGATGDDQYFLLQFRAFGRLLGKALLEGHLVPALLSDTLFKLILGAPLSFADLAVQDPGLAQSLRQLWDSPLPEGADEDDAFDLDFSVYHPATGVVDLKPGGRDVLVRQGNKREYVALFVQWQLALSARREVGALVSGVRDVLPPHLLAPFDYQELRLLMCGAPSEIDMDDWEAHATLVVAKKCPYARAARVARWFWRVLREEMSAEDREKLLQFATGSQRVPVFGFKALTTSDGRLCPFTLHVLPRSECSFPRAFTCFNRLDLPAFRIERDLRDALELVVRGDVTGFSIQ